MLEEFSNLTKAFRLAGFSFPTILLCVEDNLKVGTENFFYCLLPKIECLDDKSSFHL